jgi:hypothetical protein
MPMNTKFQNNAQQITRMIGNTAEEIILEATMEWHAGVVEDMLVGDRYGKRYRIPGAKRTYRASRPGEAPATATGRLRSSYRFRTFNNGNQLVGEVGSPLDYSVYLEYGTRRMAPRPHLLPGYYSRETNIKDILSREWIR